MVDIKKLKKSPLFLFIIIVIVIFAGLSFYNNYQNINNLENEINKLNQQIELAKEQNHELRNQLEKIEDEEYIERIAREKLGLVKPGEILLIPVDEEEQQTNE